MYTIFCHAPTALSSPQSPWGRFSNLPVNSGINPTVKFAENKRKHKSGPTDGEANPRMKIVGLTPAGVPAAWALQHGLLLKIDRRQTWYATLIREPAATAAGVGAIHAQRIRGCRFA